MQKFCESEYWKKGRAWIDSEMEIEPASKASSS